MEHAQQKETPETKAAEVFEELGLQTEEQRDRFLVQQSAAKPVAPQIHYIIRLSNNSEPAPTVG